MFWTKSRASIPTIMLILHDGKIASWTRWCITVLRNGTETTLGRLAAVWAKKILKSRLYENRSPSCRSKTKNRRSNSTTYASSCRDRVETEAMKSQYFLEVDPDQDKCIIFRFLIFSGKNLFVFYGFFCISFFLYQDDIHTTWTTCDCTCAFEQLDK